MRINCVRISQDSDGHITSIRTEEHKAEVRNGTGNQFWLYIVPGVTGYESACVSNLLESNRFNGWSACAGTPGSWDKLYIPENEMQRIKDMLRLIPQNENNESNNP